MTRRKGNMAGLRKARMVRKLMASGMSKCNARVKAHVKGAKRCRR